MSFEELSASCVGPFIVIRGTPQPLATLPIAHGPEMKLNCAVLLWAPQVTELRIELHDRDSDAPEVANPIASTFVSPVDQTPKAVKVEALSIEAILGTKKDAVTRPFAAVTIPLEPGRKLLPLQPVPARDSTMQPGFYGEAGTYLAIELENMKNCVPQLAAPPLATPTTTKRPAPPHPSKAPVVEVKQTYFYRRCLIYGDTEQMSAPETAFFYGIEDLIIQINGQVGNVKDMATVPSMKIEKEDSPLISGFIFMSDTTELILLEVLEGGASEAELTGYLNTTPTENVRVVADFTQHFVSPRAYHTFDCAVKKFKLKEPLAQVLTNPEIYIQNSHLSNCFRILNQLNQLLNVRDFDAITTLKLWPVAQELEMVNAKLGCLLTMDELRFPPRLPSEVELSQRTNGDETEEEEIELEFKYVPVSTDVIETPAMGWEHYDEQHKAAIRRIRERRPLLYPRECIAADEDTEIWRLPTDRRLRTRGWQVVSPEPYMPLAQSVGPFNYPKMLRPEDPTAMRGSARFYSYRTPKTRFVAPEQLKADQNQESWVDGDLSLANCDQRWMACTRGPIRTGFNPNVHPTGPFHEFHPISVDEEWKPPLQGTGPRVFLTRRVCHQRCFTSISPPAMKNDCLIRTQTDPPPLTVQEAYRDPEITIKDAFKLKQSQKRFGAVFPNHPVKKGCTDSMTVRNLTPTFPPTPTGFE